MWSPDSAVRSPAGWPMPDHPGVQAFPGHGHGSGDSHPGGADSPLASLQNNDLVLFRRPLANPGPAAAMVGHLIVPGLTSPDMPASLDAKAIRMLRTGKGYNGPAFNGVIFSDDLGSMAAISSKYPITGGGPVDPGGCRCGAVGPRPIRCRRCSTRLRPPCGRADQPVRGR